MRIPPRIPLSLLLLFSAASTAAAQASFQDVGNLPGEQGSRLWKVSADGASSVGQATAGGGTTTHAVRWVGSGPLEDLGDLPGGQDGSSAWGIDGNGSTIVGGSESASGTEAFRWISGTGMVGLGDLAGGAFDSTALGVSGDGSWTVGFGTDAVGQKPVRWDAAGNIQHLGNMPGGSGLGQALAISASGDVIVGTGQWGSDYWPFIWTAQTGPQPISGSLPGMNAGRAEGVSDDGQVVVGVAFSDTYIYPFRYAPGSGMQSLGYLPGSVFAAIAKDCTADGRIVVGSNMCRDPHSGQYFHKATIWDPVNGLRELQQVLENEYGIALPGWELWLAGGISADGRVIAGYGVNPKGYYRGFIATLPWPCLDPTSYCDTAPNSAGPGALMVWSGSTSASANDLVLMASGAPPNKPAIFFYGADQTQVPFGDGFRCVGTPIFRLPVISTDPLGNASFPLDITAITNPGGQIQPGDTWNFQLWYRDPSHGSAGYNVSDGLEVLFCD